MQVSTKLLPVHDALQSASIGTCVRVQGWIRTKRTSKAGLTFLEVNDGSSLQNLQAVVPESLPNYEAEVPGATTGASVILEGDVIASPAPEQETELSVRRLEVLGTAHEYPRSATRSNICARWRTYGRVPTRSGRWPALETRSAGPYMDIFKSADISTFRRPSLRAAMRRGPARCFKSRRWISSDRRWRMAVSTSAMIYSGDPRI
jgi:aspartyl/asparaginyl-tRNA synthetase